MIPSTNWQMGKARAGDVSMCPKLQSDCRSSFSVTRSVSCLLSPCSKHSSSFLAEARWSVFLFQCFLVLSITLRFRTSPFLIIYTLYILIRTPSPNLICTTCHSFPLSIMNNLASELEKTLKILHIFKKWCQDICTYLPVPCFSAYEPHKPVQTPTIHTQACLSSFSKLALNIRATQNTKMLSPCKGTELWSL